MLDVTAPFPRKLGILFEPKRYKIIHGGRGGGKSWGIARALLLLGMRKKLNVLCAREVQDSIKKSVHKLLVTQINKLGLAQFYTVFDDKIAGSNGTEFTFSGIHRNVDNVRSTEDIDIVWVEEAKSVTKNSWDVLIPTIRKPGSEIWISFNPELASDETYKRFVLNPPENAFVVQMSWRDNPWFTKENNDDRLQSKRDDPDGYLNIWEGYCRHAIEGAIFAKELRDATLRKRILHVPYDPTMPVHTFWDIGWSDLVAIWSAQKIGFEYHVIGYMEDSQKTVAWFLSELDKKGYVYGVHHLPHDGKSGHLAANGGSVRKLVKDAGRTTRVLPRLSTTAQINYARTVFPLCYFDETECAVGLERLRRYKFEIDEESGERDRVPLHDINSHGASAFMGFAVSIKHVDKKDKPEDKPDRTGMAHSEFGDFVPAEGVHLGWMNR